MIVYTYLMLIYILTIKIINPPESPRHWEDCDSDQGHFILVLIVIVGVHILEIWNLCTLSYLFTSTCSK